MRRKSIVSLALVVMTLITLFNVTLPVQAKTEAKRQIVIFEDNVDSAKKEKILEKHKAVKVKEIKGTNAVVVMASSDSKLSSDDEIRLVEEDYVVSSQTLLKVLNGA